MKTALLPVLALATLAAFMQPAKGGAEGDVPASMTSATIATTKAGYQFEIKLDAEGAVVELTATYKGKRVPAPKVEMPAVKEVDLRQVHVKGWRGVQGTWGSLDSVILAIPFQHEFRRDPEGEADDDEVRVSNVVRFLFHEGELVRWEMAVSLGEKSNAWALTFKDKGEAVNDNGKETGLTNPYWSHNPITYPTPWSQKP